MINTLEKLKETVKTNQDFKQQLEDVWSLITEALEKIEDIKYNIDNPDNKDIKDVKEILNNIENAWSGVTEAIEKLEEAQEIMSENGNFEMDNGDMNDFEIDENKYNAEILQGTIQESIEDITRSFNIKED